MLVKKTTRIYDRLTMLFGSEQSLQPGEEIRAYFPVYSGNGGGARALAYLDSAASSQKPRAVIERLAHYLSYEHANIHRGAYRLSAEATEAYDRARERVASFLQAPSLSGTIFTRGSTEAINLVAYSLTEWFNPGDVILLSILEHHSNIVPWQLLAARRGVKIQFADCLDDASFDRDALLGQIRTVRPRFVALTQLSNAFGTVPPLADVIEAAHSVGAKVLVDGAQSTPHLTVNLKQLACDFFVFSGHKIYGPTGIGALACTEEMLNFMQPFQGGGDMIASVTTEGSTWAEPPAKFEAGTPAIAEAIALATAIDFVESIGRNRLIEHERELFEYGFGLLKSEPGVSVYGPGNSGKAQVSIIPFNIDGVHPHDLASIADSHNVQLRAGHHCAMPALKRLGLPSTARASIGMYTTKDDFDALIEAVRAARKMFA